MKKLLFIVPFLFLILIPTKVGATSGIGSFVGNYMCFKGGNVISQSNFSVAEGGELIWKCPNGSTNVNFTFQDQIWAGDPSTVGRRFIFSMQPSYPTGVNKGQSTAVASDICMVTQSRIICPTTVDSNWKMGFALFIEGGQSDYWHVLSKFGYATESDKSSFANYQAQAGVNIGIQGGINDIKNGQNEIIKGQEDIKNAQNETNKKLDETNNFIKDDTPPSADISGLGNVEGLLPPGPVDSLLNIPFEFLSILTSSFSGTCKPMSMNFVFDSKLTIPCFSEEIYDRVPNYLMIFINTIPAAFILIKYFKHLYKKVDRAMSMESNADDEWGVL